MSSKPSVARRPVIAPLRSINAFVNKVVAWTTRPILDGSILSSEIAAARPSSTARAGSS